jgi:hypothetical protein
MAVNYQAAPAWNDMRDSHLGLAQGIYEENSAQQYPLGFRVALSDGRVFHYAENGGTALAAGKLIGSPLVFTEIERTITAAAAQFATQVTYTAVGTITSNQYQDGFLCVVDGAGEGLQYKIKSHPAIAAAATGTITLYDGIITALDTTSDVMLLPSLYKDVILNPDVVLKTLGVPPIPVTADYFFWTQTWGQALVLCGDSLGNAATERWCVPAAATGEFLSTAGGVPGTETIGYQIGDSSDVVDTEYFPIYLTIAP